MKIFKKIKLWLLRPICDSPPLPDAPFGNMPHASREKYLSLFEETRKRVFPEIDALERQMGFAIDKSWLDELALHTQIVIKESTLNYQHGRLLYAVLRRYLSVSQIAGNAPCVAFETGTARGFSSLCMAKAMIDARIGGQVVSLDILPHNTPMIWNCIDDYEGRKTRQQLLARWPEELGRVIFIQGWTASQLRKTGLVRVNFAFLDAQHTLDQVMEEYRYVCDRQRRGDIIVFDDVTPGFFDGVVEAVDQIEGESLYDVHRVWVSDQRGYAVATRVR